MRDIAYKILPGSLFPCVNENYTFNIFKKVLYYRKSPISTKKRLATTNSQKRVSSLVNDNERDSIIQNLLQLAKEAEKQASMAVETANRANILVQELRSTIDLLSNDMAQTQEKAAFTIDKNEYLQLIRQTEERQPQWQEDKKPQPGHYAQPFDPLMQPTQQPFDLPRNQVQGITLSPPKPTYVMHPQTAAPNLGLSEKAIPSARAAAQAAMEEKKENRLWQYLKMPVAALAVVICLRLLVFDVVQVSGRSMTPTLQPTDSLISVKIAYTLHGPQRYDIILLDAPDQSGYFIKRVIGLPNEHIAIYAGKVYINGELLSEEYLDSDIQTDGDINTIIPEGQYFVMGDNRSASLDSRADSISNIAIEHINGKAILRFYPLNSFRTL